MDKTPPIAVRTTRYDNRQSLRNKASNIQKLTFLSFFVDISKSEEISRWRPIDKALDYDFCALRHFSKIATYVFEIS